MVRCKNYINPDSYFGEKSLEKNKVEIMETLIAGMACKIYDDLQDNPLLKKYRTKTLMEALKIMHTMLFTIASLKDSMVYYFVGLSIVLPNLLSSPSSYSNPYESAVLWVCPLLFFYVSRPKPITKIEIFFLICFISTNICEGFYAQEEYSYLKCLTRFYFCFLAVTFYFFSSYLKPLMLYCVGYFLVSALVQVYSVTKSKNKRKHSPFPWLNKWLLWLDDRLESWFVKGKTNRKTVHYTNK